ncbi:sporulation protein YunB [Syntrophomonas palmitatica]|uniref:sporulation protein YunB n=1 Tax=Syntrophomonas palmitatica TaxID=402877 RepID=UPI0006D1CC14|nr:sporulation protein YunB [Syntrophomonas palmitatica]
MRQARVKVIGLGILFLVFIILIIMVDLRIKASVLEIAKSRVQVGETERINRIVNNEVVSQISYEDIVQIHKDNEGRIVLLQPNTIAMNKIMSSTVADIARSLTELRENTVTVPLGQLTGSVILAGYGPNIKVKVIPAGQISVNIINKFNQAGVNQTRHLIYFKIKTRMKLAVPYVNENVEVCTTIPLAESIIVGEVPRTYVNTNSDLQKAISVPLD